MNGETEGLNTNCCLFFFRSEVITSAEFHPSSCSLLAFGSSRGFVRLVDLRQSALCDRNVRM
jgi:serine/threonine-protein phosphatase 2A regulatory subunit B